MTKKDYPESRDLSRSRKTRRRFLLPDHYAAAQPAHRSEDHPIDLLIESLPGMAARRLRVVRLREVVQRQVQGKLDFVRYEDARTEFTTLREQAYYNLGFERGRLAGLAESSAATGTSDPAVRAFQGLVCTAVAEVKLPKAKLVAVLIDVARAVALAPQAC
jgi:hypothetical protein